MKEIGSTWGKWDFHVHTPYSILNNQFGFNPFEPEGNYHEEEFDEYVKVLFTKAIENDIVAIGITDYFMIEGYKRIKEKYIDCPEKLEKCFPDEEIRKKVKEIYVFPNIEFRLNTFVGKESVEYHVILSDAISITDIKENFLNKLTFEFDVNDLRCMTMHNIESFGNEIKLNNKESGSLLYVGLKHITISYNVIIESLSIPLFENKHIIAVPVDEDLSRINWNGRDYSIRKNIYKQSQCYLTSNQKTHDWALAKGEEQSRINEFGSIKPCIWGSDAHSYDRMFTPAQDRYCWIQAKPTFEGLLQILYEPATRVFIQKSIPFEKDPHQVIKSIQFNSHEFSREPIEFNNSLVCIIGGKSTGKSLLLRNVAYSINRRYAERQEAVVGNMKSLTDSKATVVWRDGSTEQREFVYIPQTFLNRTIDDPEKETAIDKIIEDVLHQEPKIKEAYDTLQDAIKIIKGEVFTNLTIYEETQQKLENVQKLLLHDGKASAFAATITELEAQRLALADKAAITQDEIKDYSELKDQIFELNKRRDELAFDNEIIEQISPPVVVFPDFSTQNNLSEQIGKQLHTKPELFKRIEGFIIQNNPTLAMLWEEEKKKILSSNNEEKLEIEKKQSELLPVFEVLKQKVEQNEQLKKIAEQIALEKERLQAAEEREEKEKKLIDALENKKLEINDSHRKYRKAYEAYCSSVNAIGISKSTSLSFSANIEWKKKAFTEFIYEAFDNRYFTSFNNKHGYTITDPREDEYDGHLLIDIWDALLMKSKIGELNLKGTYTLKTALERLFDNWFNLHYSVTSGNDTIADMSAGKKAHALLEWLISLKDTSCPILIDQPEDDLDNRSIYNDLVRFIKNKKFDRQIIVVTHNANVVLGADAEQIIIANQNGKDTPNNDELRFEYRSGAIEDNDYDLTQKGILYQKGIQTQICDILEGGKIALELRSNKYTCNNPEL